MRELTAEAGRNPLNDGVSRELLDCNAIAITLASLRAGAIPSSRMVGMVSA